MAGAFIDMLAYVEGCEVKTYSNGFKNRIVGKITFFIGSPTKKLELQLIFWDSKEMNPFEDGFYMVSGREGKEYQGVPQFNIDKIATKVALSEVKPEIIELCTRKNPNIHITSEYLKKEFYRLVDTLEDHLGEFIKECYRAVEHSWDDLGVSTRLDGEELQDEGKALTMWGAVFYHHNYSGGLLYHSIEVANMAKDICHRMKSSKTEMEFAIAGGLLHDIGKYFEYDRAGISYTWSSLGQKHEGHLGLGVRLLERVYSIYPCISAEDLETLCHIIESHQAGAEYGTTDPRTIAATAVMFADQASAACAKIRDKFLENPDLLQVPQGKGHRVFFKS